MPELLLLLNWLRFIKEEKGVSETYIHEMNGKKQKSIVKAKKC